MSDTDITFSQLELSDALLTAVDDLGYEVPSPIQAESIPPLLAGHDLLGQAQTGTGKTAAFALPLLSRLDLSMTQPQALVLTPTRELAIQVAEAMQRYARHLPGFHVLPIYGGQSMGTQLRSLKRGVHAVVGTPGRILDHLDRGTLKLDKVHSVVLDEADEMLKMGFIDDVERIFGQIPKERQTALFSATLPMAVRRVAERHLRDPVTIHIKTKTATVATIRQRYWLVSGLHKLDALTRILEAEDFDAMMVFVRTKLISAELAEKLEARGYASAALNGDMTQQHREQTVERLKSGRLDIVIATDVAARGLDVERISHVLNYDIPTDPEAYVHRIGRTGRAGRKGEAILFVVPRERHMLRTIERATGQSIEAMQLPTRAAISDRRIVQFKEQVSGVIDDKPLAFFAEMVEDYCRENDTDLATVAAALAYIAQEDRPLMPSTEELPDIAPPPPRAARGERGDRGDRGARGERGDRGDRGDRSRGAPRGRSRADSGPEPDTERFWVDVGRDHGVEPKHLVGAIANEAGLEGRAIGAIKLHDTFSTVDLPSSMPAELRRHLQKVRVCGRPLKLRPFVQDERSGDGNSRKPPRSRERAQD